MTVQFIEGVTVKTIIPVASNTSEEKIGGTVGGLEDGVDDGV